MYTNERIHLILQLIAIVIIYFFLKKTILLFEHALHYCITAELNNSFTNTFCYTKN